MKRKIIEDFIQKNNITNKYGECNHPLEFLDLPEEKQQRLMDWCSKLGRVKTIQQDAPSSYGLKHGFERSERGFYITNGQLKGAMILLGYDADYLWHINWLFNISKREYNKLIENSRKR